MRAVQDSFKHWTAVRRRIDYPIRECPVWRKATGGSGSKPAAARLRLATRRGFAATANAFVLPFENARKPALARSDPPHPHDSRRKPRHPTAPTVELSPK